MTPSPRLRSRVRLPRGVGRLAAALALAAGLGACGGGDGAPRFGRLVSFGDSLSDVGSYAVGGVAALGGGKYTVNGPGVRIWVERLAATLGLPAPCAAQTGLNATESLIGFAAVPVTDHAGCYAYAQGGARVTEPIGPGHAALLAQGVASGALGQLTDPVVHQIERHLAAVGGRFASDDLVTVMAGGNDVFMQLAAVSATVAAGGDAATASSAAVAAMATAGTELAVAVRERLLAQGARRVLLLAMPDVSVTPMAFAAGRGTQALVAAMVQAFNAQLAAGIAGVTDRVLYVDTASLVRDWYRRPEYYGLDDVSTPVCTSALGALGCSAATVIEGDIAHHQYADDVHPTPYGHQMLEAAVLGAMTLRGWLR